MPRATRIHGPLRPGELAEAAVLGDIALVFEVLGWFLPLGGALQVLALIPIAVLTARQRVRAAVVATTCVAATGFVIGGVGLVVEAWLYGSLGIAVGLARRQGGRGGRAAFLSFWTTALPAAVLAEAGMAAFSSLRKLLLAQVNIYGKGLARVLDGLRLDALGGRIVGALGFVNSHWYATYPGFEIVAIVLIGGAVGRYLGPLLDRIARDGVPPRRAGLVGGEAAGVGGAADGDRGDQQRQGADVHVAPVPVHLERVSYRYQGATYDAVEDLTMDIGDTGLTAIAGPNGSGKSTVSRLLAGLAPTAGAVVRPGCPGLGRPGGTAMIFQRPESQVLGVRVRDDLAWGLPAGYRCDLEGVLARVGLGGMADRETSTMSGGELQRLAIAAALVRSPRLLISDESTSMLDTEGRRDVTRLLEDLSSSGVSVVHITHRASEVASASATVQLAAGRRRGAGEGITPEVSVDVASAGGRGRLPREMIGPPPIEPLDVRLEAVGHVYAARTPWAHRALEGICLTVDPAEGVVVTGPNGSGKSTLAWVVAGLVAATEGSVALAGRPAVEQLGRVGIGFQHARLQLLRPTVLADVSYGTTEEAASEALRTVGLDPQEMGPRRVDALSGGEQRRVALAGILARRPGLVVLDEPLAGLDEETRLVLESVLRRLRQEQGIATFVVSHDPEAAAALGERLLVLDKGTLVSDERIGAS